MSLVRRDPQPACRKAAREFAGGRHRAPVAGGVPGGRLWIAPHQGHSWPSTSPELFSKVVAGFIAATAARGELAGAGRA